MADDNDPTRAVSPKAKIFISYSRKDMEFVDRLEPALKDRGFEPLIDRTEIYAFEDWWQRLQALIDRSDTVVFVLSPDSVASKEALREIEYAASLNKRLAPIVCRRVDDSVVPEALRRINFVFFDDTAAFETSVDRLAEALRTDIGWIRLHTEFGEAAHRWVAASRPGGLLLRSPTLEAAERWIASRPADAPLPSQETVAFIAGSRRGATRRRNILTASLGVGIVAALALAGLAYVQRGYAVQQRQIAEQERNRAQEGLSAATDLASSVVFQTINALKKHDLQREINPLADLVIHGFDKVIHVTPTVAAYNGRASAYDIKGNSERAIADYTSAIELDPKSAVAYSNRSAAYINKGDLDLALADASKAIELNPRFAGAYVHRSSIYRKKGNLEQAISDLNEAIAINPKNLDALFNRGTIYREMGNDKEAIADYTRAIAIDYRFVNSYGARGSAYFATGDFDRAIDDYGKAIALDSSNVSGRYFRAMAYSAQGHFDRAITEYDQMIALNPKYGPAYVNRGIAKLYLHSFADAAADLVQANTLEPKAAYTVLWLDIADALSGRPSRLVSTSAQVDMTQWPAPMIRLYLAQATPESAIAAGADGSDQSPKSTRLCEAQFFAGKFASLHGGAKEAARLFALALVSCPKVSSLWAYATEEMRTMNTAAH
jgi:tetratricopeptide (TPR) repeat protein